MCHTDTYVTGRTVNRVQEGGIEYLKNFRKIAYTSDLYVNIIIHMIIVRGFLYVCRQKNMFS